MTSVWFICKAFYINLISSVFSNHITKKKVFAWIYLMVTLLKTPLIVVPEFDISVRLFCSYNETLTLASKFSKLLHTKVWLDTNVQENRKLSISVLSFLLVLF